MTNYAFKPGDKVISKLNEQGIVLKINIHRTIKSLYTYTVDWGNGKITAAAPSFLQLLDENMRPNHKNIQNIETK
jgi:hypothetical protein